MARRPKKVHPRNHDALTPLSEQQQLFVAEYCKDFNGQRAAQAAGYSARTARVQASQLLTRLNIRHALGLEAGKRIAKAQMSADEALELLALHARGNIQDFFDRKGNLKPIHKLTREQAATIAATETVIKDVDASDGHADRVNKIKMTDRLHALEMIMKTHKLLTDVVEVQNDDAVVAMLNRAKAVKGDE